MKQRGRLAVLGLAVFIITVYLGLKRRLVAPPASDVIVEARAPGTPLPPSRVIRDPPNPTAASNKKHAGEKRAGGDAKVGVKNPGKDAAKDIPKNSSDTAQHNADHTDKGTTKDTEKDKDTRANPHGITNKTLNAAHKKSPGPTATHSTKTTTTSPASDDLVRTAVEVNRTTGLVLFTVVNNAYVDFALSWLCNTAPMRQVHHHVMLVATDNKTATLLRSSWPNIHVVAVNATQLSGDQVYSHAGYVRLMIERSRYIQRLLQSGVRTLLFEVDCVWLSNPLPHLLGPAHGEADMVATVVGNRTAGGFLLLRPTPRTLAVWGELVARLDHLWERLASQSAGDLVSWTLNDQEFLADLVKRRYGGVRVHHLPVTAFPDGTWYHLSAAQRSQRPAPVLINNNFIKGNAAKRRRAKENGHWFLKGGGRKASCDHTAVQAIVTTDEK